MEYNKQFLIIGNMNAITYKEIFPLIKDNKLWLGYTHPKEFIEPNGTIKKFGNIMWFTNLDIPKRHEDLIIWKKYTSEEYPHYDNYDAINVDKVAEIPCDYCESWGLYPEEYEVLDKAQWEEVRRETKNETELIYIIPAKDTDLRKALHEHADGYKEEIEKALAESIYCSGCMGVPITMLDKYNPEQFEIINPLDYKTDVSIDKPQKDNIIANAGMQECRNAGMQECRNAGMQECRFLRLEQTDGMSRASASMLESLSARYCNGVIGTPITFLDKWSPEQFRIKGLDRYISDNPRYGHRFRINNRETYARILIQKIL